MASQVSISNDALAELREAPIQSMDEQSFQARECTRQYPQVLAELLEAHDWGFATVRVALAPLLNDRPAEWGYAYALPIDLAKPIAVLPVMSPAGFYSPGLHWWHDARWWASYIIEGAALYTSLPGATLAYISGSVDPGSMPAPFRRALALGMAERMAVTLRDSQALQKTIGDRAAVASQRAMADDMNRQPNNEHVPDVGSVRSGGWIHWPIAPALV